MVEYIIYLVLALSIKLYNSSGFVGLMSAQFKGQKSALNTHQAVLETYFLQNPPLSIKEAIHNIKELTNLSHSPTQVRNWMNKA